ncbi:hypothetical protein QBC34DRAFT_379288 [Podospora aff. communis PSN243]|uniref:Uncharacterized protein n=1 Tax=Podospora aff. communis PSN243 TaxID=3040156 RepID=A0AAV9GQB0_9PEZI|nr:hypothetical protein QBC34DRAFT_379288 [Podospora aff. communis PSN243]
MDDDPSRTLRTQDELREIEGEAGQGVEEKEPTTTSNGASGISGRDPNRTADHGRSPTLPGNNGNSQGRSLPEDSANGNNNNNNGETAGDMNRVTGRTGRVLIEDGHEPLDSRFRELREMLPPPPAGTAAGVDFLPHEQESSGGASSQDAGGLMVDAEMEDEEVDLLERARLRILALEREQRVLAEQNGQLESLLGNRVRQEHEDRPDKEEDED